MFNTIFPKGFYKKWIFEQETDVYFGPFLEKTIPVETFWRHELTEQFQHFTAPFI
jgi:hypothetical protein